MVSRDSRIAPWYEKVDVLPSALRSPYANAVNEAVGVFGATAL